METILSFPPVLFALVFGAGWLCEGVCSAIYRGGLRLMWALEDWRHARRNPDRNA